MKTQADHDRTTIAADLAFLRTLGHVRKLSGKRLYHVTLSEGTTATAKFHDLETLRVRSNSRYMDIKYQPLEDTEIIRAFILAAEVMS